MRLAPERPGAALADGGAHHPRFRRRARRRAHPRRGGQPLSRAPRRRRQHPPTRSRPDDRPREARADAVQDGHERLADHLGARPAPQLRRGDQAGRHRHDLRSGRLRRRRSAARFLGPGDRREGPHRWAHDVRDQPRPRLRRGAAHLRRRGPPLVPARPHRLELGRERLVLRARRRDLAPRRRRGGDGCLPTHRAPRRRGDRCRGEDRRRRLLDARWRRHAATTPSSRL